MIPFSILCDINDAPAKLTPQERMLLYSLVLATAPAMALEIGTLWGGSAQIICAAMDVLGEGGIVTVDPEPKLDEQTFKRVCHRTEIVTGKSPKDVPAGPFNFIFIDGDHHGEAVARDIHRALEVAAPDAYILIHDYHFHEVRQAVQSAVRARPRELVDCGLVSKEKTFEACDEGAVWGGLRLLRIDTLPPAD